jgi:hypothetical protein
MSLEPNFLCIITSFGEIFAFQQLWHLQKGTIFDFGLRERSAGQIHAGKLFSKVKQKCFWI